MPELSEDFMYVIKCEGTSKIIVRGSNGLSRFYVARVSEDNDYTISVLDGYYQTNLTNFFTFNLVESYYGNTYGNSNLIMNTYLYVDNLYVDVYEINVSQDLVDCTYLDIICTSSANNTYHTSYNVTDSLANSMQVLYNKEGFYGGLDYVEYGKPIIIETEYLKSTTIYKPKCYVDGVLRGENYVTVTKLSENDNKIKYQFNFSDTFTPYNFIHIEFSGSRLQVPTVTSDYFAILTYNTPKPKIYTELLSATSIPSYGGTVKVKVVYEDYQSINTPTIFFNGVRQTTNYMNDNSTMSNDLYNYIFDFPEAEEDRTITIRFQAMGEGNEIVKSDIQITQKGNGGTGGGGSDDDNNDEPPLIFDDVLILNSYGDEYNYEESEDTYTLQARVKTAIDDVVGELEVVTNVNWIRVDYNNGGDINHHYYKETVFNYTINIAENTNEVSRLTVVTFNYYNTDNELIDSKDYVVVQDAEKQPTIIEYNSCWEDIIYTTDVDVFNYSVVMSTFVENDKSEEVTIFNGRAYKYPNADNIEIKLNKIFENYLTNSLTNTISKLDLNSNIDYNNRNYESCKRFMIYDRDTSELIKEYRVLYDWSYTYKWRGEEEVLSKPIDNNFAYRQLHFNTTVSKLGIVTNYITNTINNDCGDYALYYLNSFGGWDSLLLNNKVNKSKSINSYTTEKYIRNLNVDFEQYRYISELQNSYDVNTNLLTDEQATNIVDNLFTSNEVYLHNLNTDIINAVLITNNKVSYKRYSDNLELPYFTINIKESQIQLKR